MHAYMYVNTYAHDVAMISVSRLFLTVKALQMSSQFYDINLDTKAGGQDWKQLAGMTLCNTCYSQYQRRGSLERPHKKGVKTGLRFSRAR